jgi:pectate lyase
VVISASRRKGGRPGQLARPPSLPFLCRFRPVYCISIHCIARDVIIDHCSTSWSSDEGISCNKDVDRITVQWCIIGENLGKHGFGSIIGSFGGSITYHHNLYISNINRNPRPAAFADERGRGLLRWDFRNNVIHNCKGHGYNGNYGSEKHLDAKVEAGNLVANYYSRGPATRDKSIFRHVMPGSRMFAQGNLFDGKSADWKRMQYGNGSKVSNIRLDKPLKMAAVTTQPATAAYTSVIKQVGATLPTRDVVDKRLIQEVRERKGALVQNAKGLTWPKLKSVEALADTDKDGMPDAWEEKHGLKPETADNNGDVDGDGYTNLEEYLNGTNPRRKD